MSEQNSKADALFEALNKDKKRRKRKLIRTVLIIVAVIAVALVTTVILLRKNVEKRFAAAAAEVQSYQVTTGTIHTTVSGTGVLTEDDLEEITVPAGVAINEVMVDAGETVQKGDLLVTVDMATVMTALSSVQDQLNDLDNDIHAAKGEEASTQITTGISGRVKILYANVGDDVSLCMGEHGALAVLSLDGYMAADLKTDKLLKGDLVTVIREDGKILEGKVSAAAGGTVTVLVTDNGPQYDEAVTISTIDGTEIGKAKLYIHSPLGVTGFTGTINSVIAKENSLLGVGSALYSLKNTSFTANYDTLLRERAELEEDLMELLTIYRDGALLSSMDGVVSSVEFEEDTSGTSALYTTATAGTTTESTGVLTLYPNVSMTITIGIDETDILALEEGQEAEITVSSVGDDIYSGTVSEISKVADTSTGVTQYSAEVQLERSTGMLAGMTADVDIKIEGTENALIIPVDALRQTSAGSYVFTTYNEETKQYGGRVDVVAGMQNDDYAEILEGLKEGDTVYYVEQEDSFFPFGMMGGMPSGMGGGMPGMGSGGGRPSGMPGMGSGGKSSGGSSLVDMHNSMVAGMRGK